MFELSKLLEPSELLEVFGLPELPEASELPELPEASELPEQFEPLAAACCLFLLLRRLNIHAYLVKHVYPITHKRVSHYGGSSDGRSPLSLQV
jgi:hypothetical protein